MEIAVRRRLRELRADYESVVGQPFNNFYCPVLFRDEDVELCKAHVVNAAFSGRKAWTVQRKDVDNFYGSVFESDFVDIQHRGRRPDDVGVDETLSKRFRPKFVVEGRAVDYYVSKGPVPSEHSSFLMDGESGTIRIALKIHPSETLALADASWEIRFEKDLRIAALVSVLKAAHLTLFDMVGYQYALSPGGHLLGRAILGEFFLANVGRPRSQVLSNANLFFSEFAHMVRPVLGVPATFKGTAADRMVYVCRSGELTWSVIVFVRTSQSVHAALVPVFQNLVGEQHFVEFLSGPDQRIQAHLTRLEGDRWMTAKDPVILAWPKAGVLYPEE